MDEKGGGKGQREQETTNFGGWKADRLSGS